MLNRLGSYISTNAWVRFEGTKEGAVLLAVDKLVRIILSYADWAPAYYAISMTVSCWRSDFQKTSIAVALSFIIF